MTTLSLSSSSLSYCFCSDSVRFNFENNILDIVTRQTDTEKLKFNIKSVHYETINDVSHTVLISCNGDTFYIVDNKFHREDDKPAITMLRFTTLADETNDNGDKSMAKIWMKNGLYHREGDKPALIFQNGELLWKENGHFKRNPFTNASVYIPNEKHSSLISYDRISSKMVFIEDETEIQRHLEEKLLDFSYDNA